MKNTTIFSFLLMVSGLSTGVYAQHPFFKAQPDFYKTCVTMFLDQNPIVFKTALKRIFKENLQQRINELHGYLLDSKPRAVSPCRIFTKLPAGFQDYDVVKKYTQGIYNTVRLLPEIVKKSLSFSCTHSYFSNTTVQDDNEALQREFNDAERLTRRFFIEERELHKALLEILMTKKNLE